VTPYVRELTGPEADAVWLRFWRFVRVQPGCWLYGDREPSRYRIFAYEGVERRLATQAHRFAYESVFGPLDRSRFACHHCDVPGCVRPSHLYDGDNRANMLDAVARRRGLKTWQPSEDEPIDAQTVARLARLLRLTDVLHRHVESARPRPDPSL
jgi:hypothetical protein